MWTPPLKSVILCGILDGMDKNHGNVENITEVAAVLKNIQWIEQYEYAILPPILGKLNSLGTTQDVKEGRNKEKRKEPEKLGRQAGNTMQEKTNGDLLYC